MNVTEHLNTLKELKKNGKAIISLIEKSYESTNFWNTALRRCTSKHSRKVVKRKYGVSEKTTKKHQVAFTMLLHSMVAPVQHVHAIGKDTKLTEEEYYDYLVIMEWLRVNSKEWRYHSNIKIPPIT